MLVCWMVITPVLYPHCAILFSPGAEEHWVSYLGCPFILYLTQLDELSRVSVMAEMKLVWMTTIANKHRQTN